MRHVVLTAAAFGIAMLLLAASPSLAASFPIGLLVGASSIAFMTASTAIVQVEAAPDDARPGARAPGDRVPRQHADRRPAARRGLRRVRPRAGILVGGLAALAAAAWGYAVCRARAGHAATGGFDRASREERLAGDLSVPVP